MKVSQLKYSSWMVTIMDLKNPWVRTLDKTKVEKVFEEMALEYAFQEEVNPNASEYKTHFQCYLKTKIRTRKDTLLKLLAEKLSYPIERIRVEKVEGTREQAIAYVTKVDTRAEDLPVVSKLIKKEWSSKYDHSDVKFLAEKVNRYPWQQKIFEILFTRDESRITDPDDRSIIWITDFEGCTGKSKLVKYICTTYDDVAKLSFGTANQLRSSVAQLGKRLIYIIDIPRTLGHDDSINDVISVIEDLKNGFVVSSFYGNYNELIITPPHIIIFSNKQCPLEKLSKDRWLVYNIYQKDLIESQKFITNNEELG